MNHVVYEGCGDEEPGPPTFPNEYVVHPSYGILHSRLSYPARHQAGLDKPVLQNGSRGMEELAHCGPNIITHSGLDYARHCDREELAHCGPNIITHHGPNTPVHSELNNAQLDEWAYCGPNMSSPHSGPNSSVHSGLNNYVVNGLQKEDQIEDWDSSRGVCSPLLEEENRRLREEESKSQRYVKVSMYFLCFHYF